MAIINWKNESEILIEKKELKKKQLSEICQEKILKGFIFNFDGINYRFSYDSQAQKNLADTYNLFQSNLVNIMKLTAHTNDDQDVRLDFNKEVFNDLYLTSVFHREDNISRYRDQLIPMIEKITKLNELEAINWDSK